jgi:hypothetical protein
MPDFLRFRDDTGLEFDATPEHYAIRPDWTLIDSTPVQVQRDPQRPDKSAGKRAKSSADSAAEPAQQESTTTEGEPR